jgi:hypothetical protein
MKAYNLGKKPNQSSWASGFILWGWRRFWLFTLFLCKSDKMNDRPHKGEQEIMAEAKKNRP